ncbi:hypothetical protein PPYR_02629 [Photinus pyralis]|uniref:DUF5641 domain-containing protein n=1 Tax=Photinus pyralis TaxID=7054 RepID=A0A5N4B7S9_PHOPY|nr:hypothetical protein PPYR_02629 [Photinus pyralis]
MDKLKKARAPVRTQLTRLINTIGDLLNHESVDELTLQVKLESLHENARKIDDYDSNILELMAEDDNIGEDSQETEFLAQEEYRESYRMAKIRTENYLEGKRVATNDKASNVVVSEGFSSTVNVRTPHNTKYPKITIKRFEGDLKEWLGFWAQFKNIHEDPQLPVSEKFQYLVQSITKGSKAYGVVSSYPQADDNYSKVIEALKKRFWLKYTSLESLGVTREKYAAMLFPLVESSLPNETLQAWQRSYFIQDTKLNKLANLMKFLEIEVKGEERIKLARDCLISRSMHQGQQKASNEIDDKSFHTAAGLHMASHISAVRKDGNCVFCNGNHDSDRCVKAQNLTLEERRAKVHEKRRCFCCLAGGHGARFCRKQISCPVCSRKHFAILCPTIQPRPQDKDKKEEKTVPVTTMATQNRSHVLLQTIMVKLIGSKGSFNARVLLDSGAQRSYVKEDVAQSVGAMLVETEYLAQAVFGGSITPARTINKYKFMLQSLNSTTTQEIEALGQKTICEYIPKLNSGPWLRELSDKNIWINDMTSENTDVEIIIGCDYYGSIVFGKAVRLECGLTAMETIFGWTVLGEIKNNFVSEGLAMAVSCLALSNVDVSDLWRLELLGITDPIEVQSREEREHNCIVSVDSVEEMEQFKVTATELLAEAKMELRMWENTVIHNNETIPTGSNQVVKLLRLKWNKVTDTLSCDIPEVENDIDDLKPLSPSMFLRDNSTSQVIDIDKVEITNFNKRRRYQARLKADLRSRFRKEYLSLLVQRSNEKGGVKPKMGDVVIVGNDGTKRGSWPLALIIGMYPGSDGVTRVVRLRTASGELVRPVQRCYPLEGGESIPPSNVKSNDRVTEVVRQPVAEVCHDKKEERILAPIRQTRGGRAVKPPVRLDL